MSIQKTKNKDLNNRRKMWEHVSSAQLFYSTINLKLFISQVPKRIHFMLFLVGRLDSAFNPIPYFSLAPVSRAYSHTGFSPLKERA